MLGKVSRTQPISKGQRFRAILNGDFTPLRLAQVEFTTLKLPVGHELAIHTVENMGLNSIYIEPSTKKKKARTPVLIEIVCPNSRRSAAAQAMRWNITCLYDST